MVVIIKFLFNIIELVSIREFRDRFLSTIFLIFLFICLFLLGNSILSIFFSFVFGFVFFEYEKLISNLQKKIQIYKIFLLQIILLLFTFFEIYKLIILPTFPYNIILFLSISIIINFIFSIHKNIEIINLIVSNLIIFSFFTLISILQKSNGLFVLLYIVILVSTMDIFAYFGGKLLGKTKIIPKISKGKTIEGTVIGLFSTIIMSFLIKDLMHFNFTFSLIYGFIISILAFFGDIIESFFKRKIGVKDSGKLIPGHGGLMDRLDGYFLVIPFSYFFII